MIERTYPDPTGEKAVNLVVHGTRSKDLVTAGNLIHIFKCIADLAGFEIVGRITFKNKKTGRIYK